MEILITILQIITGLLFVGFGTFLIFIGFICAETDDLGIGILIGIVGLVLNCLGVGIIKKDTHQEIQQKPTAKITKCYQIENTQENACVLELPDGTKSVRIQKIEAENFVDFELEKREILGEIFGG